MKASFASRSLMMAPKPTIAHGRLARRLCDKMGWKGELIGGGFPDGTMVWVFAQSTWIGRDMQSLSELVALSIFIATLLIWAAILGGNLAIN